VSFGCLHELLRNTVGYSVIHAFTLTENYKYAAIVTQNKRKTINHELANNYEYMRSLLK
jgi:CRP-like cAMP-binding protein